MITNSTCKACDQILGSEMHKKLPVVLALSTLKCNCTELQWLSQYIQVKSARCRDGDPSQISFPLPPAKSILSQLGDQSGIVHDLAVAQHQDLHGTTV